jgi:hypothetical protein
MGWQNALLFAGFFAVLYVVVRRGSYFGGRLTFNYHPHHPWQIAFHSSIWIYWAMWIPEVAERTPSLVAQYVAALFFDALASRIFRGRWAASVAAIPITTAINFFEWFVPGHGWLMLVILAGAIFSRPLIRWPGPNAGHIFNPSAFVLSIVGIIDIFHRVPQIPIDHLMNLCPCMAEYMFIVGIFTQLYARTAAVTISSGITLMVIMAWSGAHGWNAPPSPYYPQILLAITLGVTDPATSPKNTAGKILFGIAYGIVLYGISAWLTKAIDKDYYAKILSITTVNALVPLLTKAGAGIEGVLRIKGDVLKRRWATLIPALAVWTVIFTSQLPPGNTFEFSLHQERHSPWVRFQDGVPVCYGDWVCQRFAFPEAFGYLVAGRRNDGSNAAEGMTGLR